MEVMIFTGWVYAQARRKHCACGRAQGYRERRQQIDRSAGRRGLAVAFGRSRAPGFKVEFRSVDGEDYVSFNILAGPIQIGFSADWKGKTAVAVFCADRRHDSFRS